MLRARIRFAYEGTIELTRSPGLTPQAILDAHIKRAYEIAQPIPVGETLAITGELLPDSGNDVQKDANLPAVMKDV